MAKKKIEMQDLFKLLPELPEGFTEHCYSLLDDIPVYYKRIGKIAECLCGKCGKLYLTDEIPERNEKTVCRCCGNEGYWEWRRITYRKYDSHDITLIQNTADGTLVIRVFNVNEHYQQGYIAEINLHELKRIFLRLGDAYFYSNEHHYGANGWKRSWDAGKGHEPVDMSNLYPGWRRELKNSCLRYCDIDELVHTRHGRAREVQVLIAFSNNPAIEMYQKAGMRNLVSFLIFKEGKAVLVNRRKNTLKGQLRLTDKAKINYLIEQEGDEVLLKIMQREARTGQNWTKEQEKFVREAYRNYGAEKNIEYLLQYMSVQQLINRIGKYKEQGDYRTDTGVISAYYDYLQMRRELGYDMSNTVFVYPRNLKEKHDEMVMEKNARRDELYIRQMSQKYPGIEKRFHTLQRKYSYGFGEYFIRPARNAGEIIKEGRTLHHCVGNERYLTKHSKGETSILFLRKKDEPDSPYYTIEIRKNEIVQWYGAYDKKPDEETIRKWLNDYTEHLKRKHRKAAG